ncbi:hypothetical protein AGABI1DRAFT_95731 [Agaricus bisporus var. burnettii JB137-S8]|uniref:Uncharacterized protein n=1 Tax=Agaricus bisporus var. burnettii (strain JB137-S8 / ATCC MYA-4627 / FGSC 10392) TaxID=597362 RepID=K5VIX7_AGABU|nr:uncharacterized protein AGABI1DRAFT_95731 [Agaricus bisporus var. burnettii JB137-S8]EKM74304.1 hypothetical protein AGABI1DRAFT_95731 [Agaricus bisporus var. burnettii JB137-S8]
MPEPSTSSKTNSKIPCTCGCGRIVAYSTKRAHLRGQTRSEIAAAVLETTRYLRGEDDSLGSNSTNKRPLLLDTTSQHLGRKRQRTSAIDNPESGDGRSNSQLEMSENHNHDDGTTDHDEDDGSERDDGNDEDDGSDNEGIDEQIDNEEEEEAVAVAEAAGEPEVEFAEAEMSFADWAERNFICATSGQFFFD